MSAEKLQEFLGYLNRQALAWEGVYNTVRPHQALSYKTPKQFLEELPDRSGRPP